ncbi:hypothetical protein B4135_2683 [Caldibacillus debilis]|uniref:Uncharacterized protein n=1 Tax=Caldibacillus debilis TaxID=301148 RepID=A0A150LSR8_9BACI|nr:hypothetical protein B4135_2683 [Caldibacillus debilis]
MKGTIRHHGKNQPFQRNLMMSGGKQGVENLSQSQLSPELIQKPSATKAFA